MLAQRRAAIEATDANPRSGTSGGLLDRFDERLPFTLTDGQRAIGEEIAAELGDGHPMHRLLQGEVGSGKTVVALRAMLQVVDSGGQAALLAPTEVLAQQHHRSIVGDARRPRRGWLPRRGGGRHPGRAAHRFAQRAARRTAMAEAAGGEAGIVIGTHALLEDKVQFADLGLVVVDEQHRFGVEQRAALSSKAGAPPHVLVMTATPIPRTVAMTVFGDLDTSTLSRAPRRPWRGADHRRTHRWPSPTGSTAPGSGSARRSPRAARRTSSAPGSTRTSWPTDPGGRDARPLHAVEEVAPDLAGGALTGLRVEMLHGRMTPDDKDRVMKCLRRR